MGIPKIGNLFEDETDFIDRTDPADAVKQAGQTAGNIVMKQVIKPVAQQVSDDSNRAVVDFLYGADTPPATDTTGDPAAAAAAVGAPDAGIEQLNQMSQANPQQAAKLQQQIADPDQRMAKSDKAQLTDEQFQQREKHRLHVRNYYTMGNKLDDIGQLEEQIAKVRREKEEEERKRKEEEEQAEEERRQREKEQQEQLAPPTGKKTGVAPDVLKREQNKTENKTGFSG